MKTEQKNWDGKTVIVRCVNGYQSGRMVRGRYFRVSETVYDVMTKNHSMERFSYAESEITLAPQAEPSEHAAQEWDAAQPDPRKPE